MYQNIAMVELHAAAAAVAQGYFDLTLVAFSTLGFFKLIFPYM